MVRVDADQVQKGQKACLGQPACMTDGPVGVVKVVPIWVQMLYRGTHWQNQAGEEACALGSHLITAGL